jgi:hypothetical protein
MVPTEMGCYFSLLGGTSPFSRRYGYIYRLFAGAGSRRQSPGEEHPATAV